MPVTTKKPRGATAIRRDSERFQRLMLHRLAARLRPAHVGAVALACLAAALIVATPDKGEAQQVITLLAQPGAAETGAAKTPAIETVAAGIGTATESTMQMPASIETAMQGETAKDTTVEPAEPDWHDQVVKRGDNLSLIFKRAGFDDRDVHRVVTGSAQGKALARIFPGQTVSFQADAGGELVAVRHIRSPLESVTYRDDGTGFDSLVEIRTPEVRQTWATAEIKSSLFIAGQTAGLSNTMIMELANVFGGVIDFVQDPRKGDTIQLLYEELYLDGEKYKDGDIIAASFINRGEAFNAFRYRDSNGQTGYYNEEGVSMRKAFLLAPVDFTRISSNFNPRRLHPIYKTTRPHRGTDYAAPRGTPVFATGDGKVSSAGYSRTNGNYVFIKHGEQYVTRYLHLNKRKVKQGQRVSQNQVIGTVGSTGAATGPHLHYEFLVNGVHRNPRTIHKKLPKAKSLAAAEMPLFKQAIGEATLQLAAIRADSQLALNGSHQHHTAN